jgi:hypothetical protein
MGHLAYGVSSPVRLAFSSESGVPRVSPPARSPFLLWGAGVFLPYSHPGPFLLGSENYRKWRRSCSAERMRPGRMKKEGGVPRTSRTTIPLLVLRRRVLWPALT